MTEPFAVVRTGRDLRARVAAWRKAGLVVGVAPTMGALHDGHMSLVRQALQSCDRVIVTVFVNPTQFGPGEDFDAYPRDEARDRAMIEDAGAHLLFAPAVREIYAEGALTEVRVRGLDNVLEGAFRPGHFTGVATVVAKLLGLAQADHAFFGEKDYQQLLVIRRLVQDLCIATEVHGVETVREADGLAMSSRNAYLSDEERAQAPKLHAALQRAALHFRDGGDAGRIELEAREELSDAGFSAIDYLVVADAETLEPLTCHTPGRAARVLAAAHLGRARLIDNIPVNTLSA